MEEQNLEITYIPYGQNEISLLDLMTSLADGLPGFIKQYKWLQKKDNYEKFIKAYDNITQGLIGASDSTGRWMINTKNEIDTDSMSLKDKLIYEHAAYYILLQMSKMSPRVKEEKKNLEKFNFVDSFKRGLLDNLYGGKQKLFVNPDTGWNSLDERGANGLRGTKNRKDVMSKQLQNYLNSLEEGKYNFEGTPFTNLNDAKTKILAAIDALGTNEETDDIPAFNALGLNYRTFFSNGGNDASGHADANGNPLSWNDYAKYLKELANLKAKQEAEKLKAIRANYWDGFRSYNFSNLNGRPLKQEESNTEYLSNLFAKDKWSGDEASLIVQAFKLAEQNGQLVPLSKEELSKLNPSTWKNRGRYLRKIYGINSNLYYDTLSKQFKKFYKNGELPQTSFQDILNLNSPEALTKKHELIKLEKILQANNRKLSEGFEAEDYLRMGAMAQDITGAVAAWVPTYGTAISGGLGLGSLATNFAADWADNSVTVSDMFKNAGINLALAGVGMVPGLGIAAKSGKWLSNIAKWTPRILTLVSAGHIALSDNIQNSLKKASSISNWNELTNQDIKNITYALSTVAGLSRGAKGIVNDIKFKPTVTQNTQTETYITTKSGKQIKATKELVDAINKAGRKGGNDKANEELRKLPGALNEEVNINFKTGIRGKADPTNKVRLETSTKNVGQSPEVERYSRALAIKNIRDKTAHPFLSKYLPTDYDIYLSAARASAPNINILDRIKQAWNPVPNRPFKGTKLLNQSSTNPSVTSSTSKSTGSNAKPKSSVLSKEDSKELQSTLRGKNFSTNEFKDESRVVGSVKGFGDLYGIRNTDGTHTLQIDFGGTRVNVTGTKADIKSKTLEVLRKDVMKKIDSQIPKENRSRIKFELIKLLKENGYLKQGGTIDKQKIQRYKEFIKK